MAKKNSSIAKWLGFGAAVLALVALIMMFLPGLNFTRFNKEESGSFFKIAFGGTISENNDLNTKLTFKFNFLTCLSAILIILGLVFAVLAMLKVGNSKLMAFLAAIALIAGGILAFCLVGLTSVNYTFNKTTTPYKITEAKNTLVNISDVKLGIGAILAGVFGILGGVASLGRAVVGK